MQQRNLLLLRLLLQQNLSQVNYALWGVAALAWRFDGSVLLLLLLPQLLLPVLLLLLVLVLAFSLLLPFLLLLG